MTLGRHSSRSVTSSRASITGRFSMEYLLRPRSVCIIGAETAKGRIVASNLQAGGFEGALHLCAAESIAIAALPEAPELAIIAAVPDDPDAVLDALATRGTFAVVLACEYPHPLVTPRQDGLRLLGPMSFGVAVPAWGLNASLSHMAIPEGRVALVTQSASLARAVIDWAGPNGIGFSHVIGIGANADIGFGQVLDWLSRDPGTGLIMMDIRRVRARRAFISAARAASRLRPVVALRPGGTLMDPSGRAELVFAAALQRAGVFTVSGLESFLSAAEVLSRAGKLRGEAMAVVTNAIGPGRLAADAALRAGIGLAVLPPAAQAALTGTMPAELTQGLILTGSVSGGGQDVISVAEIAAMVSAVPEVGGVLVLLSPTGPGDAAAVEALVAAAATARLPMLSCIMGESTGAAHRQRLAAAGLPAFATPEQAVQGFSLLLRDRHARAAARELPPDRVLALAPDHDVVAAALASARAAGRADLSEAEVAAVLAAYGLTAGSALSNSGEARITAHDDAMFGPAIGLAVRGAPARYGLPPLNLPLAHQLAAASGLDGPEADATAQALVRCSQLLVDEPDLAGLELHLMLAAGLAIPVQASINLRPHGTRAVLAIPPYPEQLARSWQGRDGSGSETYTVRPIRPEDAAAHAALVGRVPRDDLRYRFFTALREVPPEQIARLTQIDYEREMAFVAVRQSDGSTAGVARLLREADPARAEFAILVEPAVKGTGLASHLMRRLIEWGAGQAVRCITGQILADNLPMIAFARHLEFELRSVPGDPELVEAELTLSSERPASVPA